MENILEVKNLRVSFRTNNGTVKAVRDVSFNLEKGKTLAIVGESGSGKSVTSKVILGISAANAIIESGEIIFDSKDIIKLKEEEMCNIRGDKIAMIFQDPLSSLDPIVRIGKQITEAMIIKDKEKRRRYKKQFTSLDASLKKSVIESNDIEKRKEIDELFNKFNKFSIKSNSLASNYELSLNKINDLKNEIKDFLFISSKSARQNVKSKIRRFISLIRKIKDPFVLNEEEKVALHSFIFKLKESLVGFKQPSSKRVVVPEKIVTTVKELEKYIEPYTRKKDIDFYNYGTYLLDHSFDELIKLHNSNAAKKTTSEYFKNSFIKDFISFGVRGCEKANLRSLEIKKKTLDYIKEMKKYFEGNNIDKVSSYNYFKELKTISKGSVNIISSADEKISKTYIDSLGSIIKKYFITITNNEKEQHRFDKQTKKYNRLLKSGKTPTYKVVPLNIVSLEDIKKDILSSFDRLIGCFENLIKVTTDIDYLDNMSDIIYRFKNYSASFVSKLTKAEAKEQAIKLMEEVGIPEPRIRFTQYPFEFSGGMRQRIVIAIALAANPDILICDEPTTALDVTIQAQILELINKIKKERNLSIIFITHDLGVVANMADEIAIMYAGKIVERGTSEDIFYHPAHPYTWALLSSMPDLDTKEKLEAIPGTPPNMIYPPIGDAFAARNKYALEIDFKRQPPMFKISNTHYAATWLLHPSAPKVEMPKIIRDRIRKMKLKDKEHGK